MTLKQNQNSLCLPAFGNIFWTVRTICLLPQTHNLKFSRILNLYKSCSGYIFIWKSASQKSFTSVFHECWTKLGWTDIIFIISSSEFYMQVTDKVIRTNNVNPSLPLIVHSIFYCIELSFRLCTYYK